MRVLLSSSDQVLARVVPGTDSYCFQQLIAGITAACLMLSSFMADNFNFFKRFRKRDPKYSDKAALPMP